MVNGAYLEGKRQPRGKRGEKHNDEEKKEKEDDDEKERTTRADRPCEEVECLTLQKIRNVLLAEVKVYLPRIARPALGAPSRPFSSHPFSSYTRVLYLSFSLLLEDAARPTRT